MSQVKPPRPPEQERLYRKQRLAAALRLFARLGFDEGAAGHITAATALLPTHGVILPARGLVVPHRLPGSARRPSMRSRRLCSRRRRTRRTVSGSYASAPGRSTNA